MELMELSLGTRRKVCVCLPCESQTKQKVLQTAFTSAAISPDLLHRPHLIILIIIHTAVNLLFSLVILPIQVTLNPEVSVLHPREDKLTTHNFSSIS